jgi:2Fe-2S ferredoxin
MSLCRAMDLILSNYQFTRALPRRAPFWKINMTKVTFIEHNGTVRNVDVDDGLSVMEAAVNNLVPGIDGDCGGACACATCHVHIDAAWLDKLPPMEAMEKSMLEFAEGRNESSRLGCQIKLSPALDGIVVRTPLGQH